MLDVPPLTFTFDISEWEKYRNLNWTTFISRVVLGGGGDLPVISDISDYSQPWVWVRHHWAPVWLTCGVCQDDHPVHYVLKVETLEEDITSIMEGNLEWQETLLFQE